MKSRHFQGLENVLSKFKDFQDAYEPCLGLWNHSGARVCKQSLIISPKRNHPDHPSASWVGAGSSTLHFPQGVFPHDRLQAILLSLNSI